MEETVYSLDDDNRLNLEYYKNNILHFFVSISFVAASLFSSHEDMISINRIVKDFQFLKRLFWQEFIFDDGRDDLDEVNDVLAYLNSRGMITVLEHVGQALVEVKGRGKTYLMPFAGLISNYMESYWVVIRGCMYLRKGALPERDWMRKIQQLGAKMYKKGEIRRAEAMSQLNYHSAVEFLQEDDIVYVSEASERRDRKETNVFTLTGNKAELDSVRRRLFEFL